MYTQGYSNVILESQIASPAWNHKLINVLIVDSQVPMCGSETILRNDSLWWWAAVLLRCGIQNTSKYPVTRSSHRNPSSHLSRAVSGIFSWEAFLYLCRVVLWHGVHSRFLVWHSPSPVCKWSRFRLKMPRREGKPTWGRISRDENRLRPIAANSHINDGMAQPFETTKLVLAIKHADQCVNRLGSAEAKLVSRWTN